MLTSHRLSISLSTCHEAWCQHLQVRDVPAAGFPPRSIPQLLTATVMQWLHLDLRWRMGGGVALHGAPCVCHAAIPYDAVLPSLSWCCRSMICRCPTLPVMVLPFDDMPLSCPPCHGAAMQQHRVLMPLLMWCFHAMLRRYAAPALRRCHAVVLVYSAAMLWCWCTALPCCGTHLPD